MRHFPLIGSTSNLPLFSSLTSPVDIKFVKKYLELISITLPIKRLVVNVKNINNKFATIDIGNTGILGSIYRDELSPNNDTLK